MPRISNKQLRYSSDSESENKPLPFVTIYAFGTGLDSLIDAHLD